MLRFLGRVAMGTFLLALAAGCGTEIKDAAGNGGNGGGGGGTGGSTETGGGGGDGAAPTFTQIYGQILQPHACAGSYCHIGGFGAEDMHLAYTHLVGAPAMDDGECKGHTLVVPGDPEHSLVYLKVASTEPPCGKSMPPSGLTVVSPDDVALLRAWIAAGAPE